MHRILFIFCLSVTIFGVVPEFNPQKDDDNFSRGLQLLIIGSGLVGMVVSIGIGRNEATLRADELELLSRPIRKRRPEGQGSPDDFSQI